MKNIYLPLLLFLFIQDLKAQTYKHVCTQEQIENPEIITEGNQRISYPSEAVPDTAVLIRIPVVFNVIHLGEPIGQGTNVSDQVLKNAVDHLNNYYRKQYDPYKQENKFFFDGTGALDTKVEFYLANVDSLCNYSSGIRRFDGRVYPNYEAKGMNYETDEPKIKEETGTHVTRYLNIWIVNKIYSNSDVIGYAYTPQSYGLTPNFGIVVVHDNINRVLPHEVGHFLGLEHSDMAIGGFTNLHSFKIVRQWANFYKGKLLASPFACIPQFQNEAGLVNIRNSAPTRCAGSFAPTVQLRNFGSSNVATCHIKIQDGDAFLSTHTWNGSLAPLDSIWVDLPTIDLSPGNYRLQIVLETINGSADSNPVNDTLMQEINVVGFISLPLNQNFNDGNVDPLTLKYNDSSSVSIISSAGVASSSALLFEGIHKPSFNGVIPPGAYNPFHAFGENNSEFFATASACIATTPDKHYKINFDRYQDAWSASHFRILANGQQVKAATSGQENVWKKDSVLVSSYGSSEILLTFQSSCNFSYATLTENGYGDYILIDNLSIQESPSFKYSLSVNADGITRACAPLSVNVKNATWGAPLPVSYEYLLTGPKGFSDTIRDIENVGYFITDKGIYNLKVYATFQDGEIDSVYYPSFINTSTENVGTLLVTADDPNDWVYGNSYLGANWDIAKVGAYGNSSKSMRVNYTGISSGYSRLKLTLTSIPYNFSTLASPMIIFDRAYASPDASTAASEYLSINYSYDCGQTWHEASKQYGTQLKTVEYNQNYFFDVFTPASSEWDTDTVLIPELAGKDDVLIQFAYHPEPLGNSIYVDNIKIEVNPTTATAITTANNGLSDFQLYPNPATSHLTIQSTEPFYKVEIYNAIGKKIESSSETGTLNISHLPSGIYMVKIFTEANSGTARLIKE